MRMFGKTVKSLKIEDEICARFNTSIKMISQLTYEAFNSSLLMKIS